MQWVLVVLMVNCWRGRIGQLVEMPEATALRYVEDGRAVWYLGRKAA